MTHEKPDLDAIEARAKSEGWDRLVALCRELRAARDLAPCLRETMGAATYLMQLISENAPAIIDLITLTGYDGFGVRAKEALTAYDALWNVRKSPK